MITMAYPPMLSKSVSTYTVLRTPYSPPVLTYIQYQGQGGHTPEMRTSFTTGDDTNHTILSYACHTTPYCTVWCLRWRFTSAEMQISSFNFRSEIEFYAKPTLRLADAVLVGGAGWSK